MIRLAGIAQSADRHHYPPPPAASSTLSPLAPPFTVDRYVPANPNPNPNPNPNSLPPMSPYFVPTSESVWSSSSSGVGPAEASRYYPYKGFVGGWSGGFDLEEGRAVRGSVGNSSWTDSLASCQMLKKRGTVDSLNTYEDSFGSWHGAHNESSITLGHVGSECSEWLNDSHKKIYVNKRRALIDGSFPAEFDTTVWPNEGSSYFYSPETTSVVKECDTFIPSSYDRYISELISSSRDLEVHYPAQTSSSRQEYVPFTERTESVLSCVLKHGNSIIKNDNLYRNYDDYADYLNCVKNETSIYDNTEGNEGLEKMGISGDAMQRNRGALDPYLQIKGLPAGNCSDLGQSIDCLQDVKFGFKESDLSCCNASNFERASFIPDDSMQTTQEILDHLNVAVDSPCWKGASVSRQHPFSSNEIAQPVVISVTSGSDDLVLGQRSLKKQSDIEQDVTAVCYENGKNIDLSTVTDLSGSDLKFQDCVEGQSNPAKIENTKEIEQHDIREEQISVLNEVSIPQGFDDHVRQLSQVENIICKAGLNSETIATVQNSDFVFHHISASPNCFSSSNTDANKGEMNLSSLNVSFPAKLKKSVSSDAPSKCLSQEQDTQVLIKAMLSLSDVLLCHNPNDNGALEECELKSVQQIIDNLEALILRNKKGIKGSSSRSSRVEEIQTEIKDSNAEISSDEALTDAKENKNDKHDNIVKSFSTSFRVSDGMAQEEDPKILLYKNLWVQTEATLCSLKHDVALLKLEMGSLKHLFKAKSQVSSNGLPQLVKDHDDLNCATSISVENPNTSNTQVEQNYKQSMPNDDVIDTSVLARYRILKGRDEVVLPALNVDREEVGEKKQLSLKLADVNTVEKGVFKQNSASKLAVASPKKNMAGEKLPALNQRMEMTESHISASDGSVIQSYNPKSHGKWLFSSGSGSPSSEWEHVLKDEFIW